MVKYSFNYDSFCKNIEETLGCKRKAHTKNFQGDTNGSVGRGLKNFAMGGTGLDGGGQPLDGWDPSQHPILDSPDAFQYSKTLVTEQTFPFPP